MPGSPLQIGFRNATRWGGSHEADIRMLDYAQKLLQRASTAAQRQAVLHFADGTPRDGVIALVESSALMQQFLDEHPEPTFVATADFASRGPESPRVDRVLYQSPADSELHDLRASGAELHLLIGRFLSEFPDSTLGQRRSVESWLTSSEKLLEKLERLLDEKAQLQSALRQAYDDLDVAKSRIRQLEALRDALREERYGVREHTEKDIILGIAMIVATLLSPFVAVLTEHELEEPVANTLDAAQEVRVDCGDTTVNVHNDQYTVEDDEGDSDPEIVVIEPKANDGPETPPDSSP